MKRLVLWFMLFELAFWEGLFTLEKIAKGWHNSGYRLFSSFTWRYIMANNIRILISIIAIIIAWHSLSRFFEGLCRKIKDG